MDGDAVTDADPQGGGELGQLQEKVLGEVFPQQR